MAANDDNAKQQQLDRYRLKRASGYLTTQQGVRVDHTDDALTAGERGPTLLEDFHAREKLTHFDHERIPSAWCMLAVRAPTATSSRTTTRCRSTQLPGF
ncbi:catalase family protein [Mycobacterium xenopi 4042]|uniref:catalase n=1 Tax=Mycobacterium xenopi 4042 TaxID=1299334 RepID=X7YKV6_MYCXE|nr:catalase family protein [Mycobacterium xenopi 4042]